MNTGTLMLEATSLEDSGCRYGRTQAQKTDRITRLGIYLRSQSTERLLLGEGEAVIRWRYNPPAIRCPNPPSKDCMCYARTTTLLL